MAQRVEILKRKFVRRAGLPFQDVLSEASIQAVLTEEEVKYRNRLYTPMVTIWMFLSQVLEPDKSLSNTVKRARTWLVSDGAEPPIGQVLPCRIQLVIKKHTRNIVIRNQGVGFPSPK